MNIEQFRKLSLVQRYEITKNEGKFISARIHWNHRISLFRLFDFYVEVYQTLGLNQVQFVEYLPDDMVVQKYLWDKTSDI